ncbi:MAG: AtpZ/AtpI family protein [Pseudomonadota bacterium]
MQQERKPASSGPGKVEQANWAWHMVIELVAGMGLGLAIGWGLDWLFGTLPIFLMIFGLAGFAAGIKVMLETAKEMQKRTAQERAALNKEED